MGIYYIENLVKSDMRSVRSERMTTSAIKDRINSYSPYIVTTDEVLRALKRLEEKGIVNGFNSESGFGYKWELAE